MNIFYRNNIEQVFIYMRSKKKRKKEKLTHYEGFPGGADSKEPTCNAGDLSSIPGSGRTPG